MFFLTNKAELAGVITDEIVFSHFVHNEKFFSTQLEVQRLSGACDIIPITLPEKLIMQYGIEKGMSVRFSGQLRSYNHYINYSETDSKHSKLVITAFCKEVLPFEGSVNDMFLDGYICKPPVFRSTPFGKQITDVLVAVNRSYGKSDYIPIIFWGSNAASVYNLSVGTRITVSGRLQSRQYEKRISEEETEVRTAYEVSGFKYSLHEV